MSRESRLTVLMLMALAVVSAEAIRATGADDSHTQPPAGLTPQILDQMKVLPGAIGALPTAARQAEDDQIRLGRMLFFDKRLSRQHDMSCATCHDPALGFADGRPLAKGFAGKTLGRHTPTVLNAVFNGAQFWDGRAATLEEQATGPIMAAGEMNMPTAEEVATRVAAVPEYRDLFAKVYGREPSLKLVGVAIAAFEATLTTPDSPFDRYARGDKRALTLQEKRGLALLVGKASCTQCHRGMNFSDDRYYSLGAMPGSETRPQDPGRYQVTKNTEDLGAFKTPTLRNVSHTGPYMHDGSLATLEEVVAYYNRGGGKGTKSNLLFELHLTDAEQRDLVAFLKALSGTIPRPNGFDVPRDPSSTVGGADQSKRSRQKPSTR